MVQEQNNAGVDQGEKALLEIVMAGFETLNKSIVSLGQQDKLTSEEYQLDDLPDDKLADPGLVNVNTVGWWPSWPRDPCGSGHTSR